VKCRGAVLSGIGADWEIREITLDPPREGEVLVKMAVPGICHSDDHYSTGDGVMTEQLARIVEATGGFVPEFFPMLGGHEGAGVVEEVGPGVRSVQPGTTYRPRTSRRAEGAGGVCPASPFCAPTAR
jgi:Zn-dependent alcohol dehydrogenase